MRAMLVEVIAACRHQIADIAQGVEEVLVQQLISHLVFEAFHEVVLRGLARGLSATRPCGPPAISGSCC